MSILQGKKVRVIFVRSNVLSSEYHGHSYLGEVEYPPNHEMGQGFWVILFDDVGLHSINPNSSDLVSMEWL